jgi:hypothetical protein
MARRSKKRGGTILELMTAVCLSIVVLSTAVGILFTGTASWANGLGTQNSQNDAVMAVRTLSDILAPAMSVSVSADGSTVTYELPQTDANGNYTYPLAWDDVTRTISTAHNEVILSDGNNERVLINSLIYTDPYNSNAAYKVFTPLAGSTVRQMTIEIATQYHGYKATTKPNRDRETINFRNVAPLSTRGG